jgi:carbon monoxide dehydrogenase subunit G
VGKSGITKVDISISKRRLTVKGDTYPVKIEGNYTFQAPRGMVFGLLQDPEVLAKIIPGCEELTKTAENEYEAALEISIGPIKGKFKGKVIISDLNDPESYTMEVSGNGAPGFVKGTGHVMLAEAEQNTLMSYQGDAMVGGKIASVGQRLVESAAKALIKQSLEGVNLYINAHMAAQAAVSDITPDASDDAPLLLTPPPVIPKFQAQSQVEFATGVAKGVVEDLIPTNRRPLVIAGGVVVLVLLFLILRPRKKKS